MENSQKIAIKLNEKEKKSKSQKRSLK